MLEEAAWVLSALGSPDGPPTVRVLMVALALAVGVGGAIARTIWRRLLVAEDLLRAHANEDRQALREILAEELVKGAGDTE